MSSSENEVSLLDVRLPLAIPVRRSLATPFPGKVTFGDYARDDEVVKSSWVISSMTGGLGKRIGKYPQDSERYDFGDLEARYADRITLGQAVTKLTDLDGPADVMIDYNEVLYYVVEQTLYRWDDDLGASVAISTSGWPQPRGKATDIAIMFGDMWIQFEQDLVQYSLDGQPWITHSDTPGVALVGWDDKLFRLDNDNTIYWTTAGSYPLLWGDDPAEPQQAAGQVPLPSGYVDQLSVYFDQTGEPIIYAATKVGLWAYDFDQQKFFPTGAKYPTVTNRGKRNNQWRDEFYVATGAEEMKFNSQTFQPTGPNRDDGLPEYMRGDIARIVPGHAFRYAFINGKVEQEAFDPLEPLEPLFVSAFVEDAFTYYTPIYQAGAILATPGTAWHALLIEPRLGDVGWASAIVATVGDHHRLFFSTQEALYAIDSPTSMHNPLQNPNTIYKPSGFLDTPWFDAGFNEMDKLAIWLDVSAQNVAADRPIRFYVGWDDDETWHLVGEVTASGHQRLTFGAAYRHGKLFKNCRFRIEMETADTTKTPILRSAILKFTREPDKYWVYQVDIGIPEKFGRMTDRDIRRFLEEASERKLMGEFAYRRRTGEEVVKLVKVTAAQFVDHAGDDFGGRCILTLLEMDS